MSQKSFIINVWQSSKCGLCKTALLKPPSDLYSRGFESSQLLPSKVGRTGDFMWAFYRKQKSRIHKTDILAIIVFNISFTFPPWGFIRQANDLSRGITWCRWKESSNFMKIIWKSHPNEEVSNVYKKLEKSSLIPCRLDEKNSWSVFSEFLFFESVIYSVVIQNLNLLFSHESFLLTDSFLILRCLAWLIWN